MKQSRRPNKANRSSSSSALSEDDLYQRRFRAIFEQSEVPTQLYNSKGHILACNDAWYRWTRLTPEKVEGLKASGYCLLDDPALIRTGVAENFRKALKGTAVQDSRDLL